MDARLLQNMLEEDDLGYTLPEGIPNNTTTFSVMLIGRKDSAKLGGEHDQAGAALDKSATPIAEAVAHVLRISHENLANGAFATTINVSSGGTYDCTPNAANKTQKKHIVMVCISDITTDQAVAALAALHNQSRSEYPFTGASVIVTLPNIPIYEGKSDRSTHSRDVHAEIGLAGEESKFLALAVDGLSLADDQGKKFSFRFQPPRPINLRHYADCIAHATENQLATFFSGTKPTVLKVLPISPCGLRNPHHLPSAVLVTLSAPSGAGILALPVWLKMPTGQVFHPGHGRGNKPCYRSVQPNWFLNGKNKDGLFLPTGAIEAAAQNGHTRQLQALRARPPPTLTRAARQKERYLVALQTSPPGTDLAAQGIHPHRQRPADRRASRSRSRSPPRDALRRPRLAPPAPGAHAGQAAAGFPVPPSPPHPGPGALAPPALAALPEGAEPAAPAAPADPPEDAAAASARRAAAPAAAAAAAAAHAAHAAAASLHDQARPGDGDPGVRRRRGLRRSNVRPHPRLGRLAYHRHERCMVRWLLR